MKVVFARLLKVSTSQTFGPGSLRAPPVVQPLWGLTGSHPILNQLEGICENNLGTAGVTERWP